MSTVVITLTGCDSSTDFVVRGLPPDYVAVLENIAKMSVTTAGTFCCNPRMGVEVDPAEGRIKQVTEVLDEEDPCNNFAWVARGSDVVFDIQKDGKTIFEVGPGGCQDTRVIGRPDNDCPS